MKVSHLLIEMIEQGNLAAIRHLVESDAEFSAQELCEGLDSAARLGRTQIIRLLVEVGADPNCRASRIGWTPLFSAVEHEQLAAARTLLELGAKTNEAAADGMTPLHLAVDVEADSAHQIDREPSVALIQLLLDYAADPRIGDKTGATAIEWAREYDFDAAAELMIQY